MLCQHGPCLSCLRRGERERLKPYKIAAEKVHAAAQEAVVAAAMQALYGADHASSWSGRPGGTLATAQHPAPHDPITDGPSPPLLLKSPARIPWCSRRCCLGALGDSRIGWPPRNSVRQRNGCPPTMMFRGSRSRGHPVFGAGFCGAAGDSRSLATPPDLPSQPTFADASSRGAHSLS